MEASATQTDEEARRAAIETLGLAAAHVRESLDRAARLLARGTRCPIALLAVPAPNRPHFPAAVGLDAGLLPRTIAFCEETLRADGLLAVEDAALDPRFCAHALVTAEPRIRFAAGVPVRDADGIAVAALLVLDVRTHRLDPSMRETIDDVRVLVEDQLRLSRELATDPLTGAVARRSFDDLCGREWRRAIRALTPMSLLVAEIDGLDALEKAEGAAARDRGLRAAALAMQYSIHRPGDRVCRYDATRFAILLPLTDGHGAAQTAERIRLAVGALRIPHSASAHGVLTASLGIDTVLDGELLRTDADALAESATAALRTAQAGGGNRWETAPRAKGGRGSP